MKTGPITTTSGSAGTVVGVNVSLTGTLREQDDIEIHGSVEGEIISERSVVIGESAKIKGPVKAKVVTIGGSIQGSIDAEEKLEILESGKVFGSIATKDLIIRSGAVFVGDSTMPNNIDSTETKPHKQDQKEESPLQPDAE